MVSSLINCITILIGTISLYNGYIYQSNIKKQKYPTIPKLTKKNPLPEDFSNKVFTANASSTPPQTPSHADF